MNGNGKQDSEGRHELKTGVLGGTFDPVHNGHIMIAGEAMKELALDEVLFVPTAQTPLKEDVRITTVEHRVRMVELAICGISGFSLSRIDIDREGTSYTVDTLELLKENHSVDRELYFIIGLDNLESLRRWKDPERLVNLCHLVTVRRPGYEMPELAELQKQVPGLSQSFVFLDRPEVDISATGIRQKVHDGQPVTGLVPGPVEEYILKHGLYRQ